MVKIFDKEYLIEELILPDKAILDTIVNTSRWSVHHEIIFCDQGKYWKTWYSIGATEQQDEWPWEHQHEVECFEVEKREVVVETWVEV